MWKLGLNISVCWLALLCVVTALGFVGSKLKHAPLNLNSELIQKCLISQTQRFHYFSLHYISVTLSAATPAYFRGFTLIALKEGKEGDKEEDHAGTFQVRDYSLTSTSRSLPYFIVGLKGAYYNHSRMQTMLK